MAEQEYILGIDLGGTKILAALIDRRGQILARAKKKTRADLGPQTILERTVRTAREVIALAEVDPTSVVCAGIGVPGPIDSRTGVITEAPNLGFKNVNVMEFLGSSLGLESFAFNDVNAGAWGEYAMGAGQDSTSCLGVFVGTGIGCGIIIDHKLYEGTKGYAGEIGHMIIDINGPLCGCGRRGCLEALASRTAMTRDIWTALGKGGKSTLRGKLKKKGEQIRSSQIKEAYEAGDKLVCRVLDRAALHLGIGLGSAANLLNPDCIVLGGGVVTALGGPYLEKIREAMRAHSFQSVFESVKLVEATLGDDAGVIGAALLARKRLTTAQVA